MPGGHGVDRGLEDDATSGPSEDGWKIGLMFQRCRSTSPVRGPIFPGRGIGSQAHAKLAPNGQVEVHRDVSLLAGRVSTHRRHSAPASWRG